MNARKCFGSHNVRAWKVFGLKPEFTFGEFEEWYGPRYGRPCSCGAKAISLDHMIPLSRGGRHALVNFQFLCRSCNSRKGAWLQGEKRVYPWDKPGFIRYVGPIKRRVKPEKPIRVPDNPVWQGLDPRHAYVLMPDGRVYYRFEVERA